jgi:hypothetical protein
VNYLIFAFILYITKQTNERLNIMTNENILKLIDSRDETEVQITFLEDNQMRVYAIQDAAPAPYLDCIVTKDMSLIKELETLETVDEVICFSEV